jgi:hypothetical protein
MPALRSTLLLAVIVPFAFAPGGCKGDDDDVGGVGTDPGGTTGDDDDSTGAGPSTTTAPGTSTTSDDDDDDTGQIEPGDEDAFRFTAMSIRDPHFYASLPLFGCRDVTDSVPVGDSINESFNAAIAEDGNDNGLLDLSLLLVFRPLNQADGASGSVDFTVGDCSAPADSTACDAPDSFDPIASSYTVMQQGTCHEPDASHLSSANYNPQPGTTMGPCFHAGPTTITIETDALDLPLQDAEIAGTFDADPAQAFMSGTMRGFLTEAAAQQIELPEDIQDTLSVRYVSQLLPGGCGPDADGPGSGCNCAGHDDRDGDGWWFYVDFTAARVPWSE